MKILRKVNDTWEKQDNEDKHYCDECKHQLYELDHETPTNSYYCNTPHCGQDYLFTHQEKHD